MTSFGEVRHCDACKAELKEGEEAYAVTTGELDYEQYGGFVADDLSPWHNIFHRECWEELISSILK